MQIPETTDQATVEFLTEALRSTGTIGADSSVEEVEHEAIGVGVGIVGQLARLHLRYRGDARDAPGSAVLKLPSQFPENRAIGDHFHFYEREGRFYEEINEKLPVRTARCFWNHIDPDSNTFGLLLEDLSHRISISQIAGAGPERAGQALSSLAALHADWWDAAALSSLDWMPRLDDPVNLSAGAQYRESWPRFVELLGDTLPPEALTLGERVQHCFEELLRTGMRDAPTTICHGDYRLDNLLFDDDATDGDRVAVLDWQITYRGPAVSDVAYFLCQSLDVPVRQAHEKDLLRHWYETVATARGERDEVDGYPFAAAWDDYRRSVASTTVYAVTAAGAMDPANDRGRELVLSMSQRSFSAALQLQSAELLPG